MDGLLPSVCVWLYQCLIKHLLTSSLQSPHILEWILTLHNLVLCPQNPVDRETLGGATRPKRSDSRRGVQARLSGGLTNGIPP